MQYLPLQAACMTVTFKPPAYFLNVKFSHVQTFKGTKFDSFACKLGVEISLNDRSKTNLQATIYIDGDSRLSFAQRLVFSAPNLLYSNAQFCDNVKTINQPNSYPW